MADRAVLTGILNGAGSYMHDPIPTNPFTQDPITQEPIIDIPITDGLYGMTPTATLAYLADIDGDKKITMSDLNILMSPANYVKTIHNAQSGGGAN